ncbi:MAG TPA: autotransporter assembly complex family protein [Kiritimatiellia bacterium]|nr:autotransporter assembly complex family protein [Kiritimatiellia bacterium]HRZ11603.1 autotransporter assembly complex family protein [Kiritimatiellia bacterium]HSA16846.1 autotransporter assembly complex family protein [Kiritimatiellia bacterium]
MKVGRPAWPGRICWRTAILLLAARTVLGAETVPPCDVRIEGAPGRALRKELLSVTETWLLRHKPPPTQRLLLRRAEKDVVPLQAALRARGYYAATVEPAYSRHRQKPRITFRIRPGPVYLIRSVSVEAVTGAPPESVAVPSPARLGLVARRPLLAQEVLDAEAQVLRAFQAGGYPAARLAGPAVTVDHAGRVADVRFRVEPGPRVRFGPVRIRGLNRLRESFVRGLIPWREGDWYDIRRVDRLRDRLALSGPLSAVEIDAGRAAADGDEIPVALILKERKRRRVELGVGYATDGGADARASWLHRNLFGGAEQLELQLGVSESLLFAEASFRRPQFGRPDQDLLLDLKAQSESAEAYTSQWVRAAAGLERELSPKLRAQGGLSLRYSEVEQEEREDYFLWALPARLIRDTSNDLLDPTRGTRLSFLGAPTYDLLNGEMAFFRAQVSAAGYWRLARQPLLVLAWRFAAGSLLGPSRGDIPADERFYAGGGGSIRGYAYQEVGPLDEGDDPLGGRSLLESSVEMRWRATRSMGLVLFADGGSAFESNVPDFDENYLWGAGVGWRYYTSFGLVRVDVAVPLDQRPDVDEDYQFYVSIGQAF